MTDSEIISMYMERNEKAISATAEKYGSYCLTIAKNILGNNEDAQECVNDAYLQLWNSIPPNQPNVFSAYLGKITRNRSFNKYKRSISNKRGGGETTIVLDELAELVSGNDTVEESFDTKELSNEINTFLNKISPLKRDIFIRRYWYTESIIDIANHHRMTTGAVSMALNRLRTQLRNYLYERGFEL